MKIAFRIASLVVLAVLSTYYMSCKKEDDPTPPATDALVAKFSGTWSADEAADVLYETNPQASYVDFSITINGSAGSTSMNYQISGRPLPSPWPASGTLTFGSDPNTQLVRDDQIPITYSFVDDNTLKLNFDFDKENPYTARGTSVGGEWVFTLTKQ